MTFDYSASRESPDSLSTNKRYKAEDLHFLKVIYFHDAEYINE